MKVQLTETAINSAARRAAETRKRVELADKTLPGLRLRVTPAGTRSWVLGMRDREGKPRRFPVGEFPAVGIAEARERARNLRQGVRYDEADPIKQARETRKAAADAAEGIGTLRAILNQYEANAGAALKSWPHSRLRVERVFKAQLDRPAKALTVAELLIAADGYKAQASAAFATRTLRPVLKWAAARELVPPGLAALARRDPVRRRTRVLLEAELVKILPALRALKPHAAALRFMEQAHKDGKLENPFEYGNDFGSPDETWLSSQFDRPVMVHRYPADVKAFYMEPDPEDPRYALCVDVLAPEGYGEVIGGSQRVSSYELLSERIDHHKLPREAFEWYLDLRRYGSVPHSGFGMGIERVVSWVCGLDHVRETIPFARTLHRIYP